MLLAGFVYEVRIDGYTDTIRIDGYIISSTYKKNRLPGNWAACHLYNAERNFRKAQTAFL